MASHAGYSKDGILCIHAMHTRGVFAEVGRAQHHESKDDVVGGLGMS